MIVAGCIHHGDALLNDALDAGALRGLDPHRRAIAPQAIVCVQIAAASRYRKRGCEIDADVAALETCAQRVCIENISDPDVSAAGSGDARSLRPANERAYFESMRNELRNEMP